jgi:hypothetical protein
MADSEKNQQSWITGDGWQYDYKDGELTIMLQPDPLFVGSGSPDDEPIQITLSTQATYDLLAYLNQHLISMFTTLHPETKQEQPLQWPETRDVHEDYQPQKGDVYLLEVHTRRFMVHRHNGQRWQYLTNKAEKDAHTFVAPMHYLGQLKGFRQNYRPTEADGQRVQRESE